LCGGMSLSTFLGTRGLGDAQVQYDASNNRFFLIANTDESLPDPNGPETYIAATAGGDACGIWHVYQVQLTGQGFKAGDTMEVTGVGQDTGTILVSGTDFPSDPHGSASLHAFAILKANIYAGSPLSFPT